MQRFVAQAARRSKTKFSCEGCSRAHFHSSAPELHIKQGLGTAVRQGFSTENLAAQLVRARFRALSRGGRFETAWAEVNRASREQLAALKKRLELWEHKVVAISSSLYCSASGQKLLAFGLPLTSVEYLLSERGHCASARDGAPAIKFLREEPGHKRLGMLLGRVAEELFTLLRGLYLFALFLPAVVTLPLSLWTGLGYDAWLRLLLWTLEQAGPAFIKWGQWAATRPDLFSPQLCSTLSMLHARAPCHPFAYTRRAVEAAFRRPMYEIFSEFDPAPVASGSIAQVHRAVLTAKGASGTCYKPGTVVAVKVRHPGVSTMMQRDFTLMHRAAMLSRCLPVLADLQLEESVRQFGGPLKEQLDLQLEASHLARFIHNFRRWRNLSFPAPIFPLVTSDVLVETFEHGRLISSYVNNPSTQQSAQLANIGLNCYLQMLLKDNFIHADLHPGNILVRLTDPNSLYGRIAHFLHLRPAPHLVLLDVGMIAELTEGDKTNLVRFFKAITKKDGAALGRTILQFADEQTCPDPSSFVADMERLFDGLDAETITEYTSEVIADIMERIRRHQVALKGVVSTVVVTTLVLEGWSTKLNPDIKILDKLKRILPMSLSERFSRTVDKLMSDDTALTAVIPP